MMFIFEIATNYFRWLPWASVETLEHKRNFACGWLCFAVRIVRHDMLGFGWALKNPNTRWKD